MSFEYGYGKLEDELIDLFRSGAPDFDKAEGLIRQGADVNSVGEYADENVLSEILTGYHSSRYGDRTLPECEDCKDRSCEGCDNNKNPELGKSMCQIIRFFLSHGFNVNKFDGCYGAQCLHALVLSSFDRYFLEATRILFDAGAINRTISNDDNDEDATTPWRFVGMEGSYQDTCCHNHSLANIYEAVYQMYNAVDEGRPYKGIDVYEAAIGKKILKVVADRKDEKPVFYSMNLPEFKKHNCFNDNLYFVYEDGVLITTQYAEFWVDTEIEVDNMTDISEYFPDIVGKTIKQFSFDHRTVVKGNTHYGQPIVTLEMEEGNSIEFSINFGLVKEEERAAYFKIKTNGDKDDLNDEFEWGQTYIFKHLYNKRVTNVRAFGVDEFDFSRNILGYDFSVGEFGYTVFEFGDEKLYFSVDGLTLTKPERENVSEISVHSSISNHFIGAELGKIELQAEEYFIKFKGYDLLNCHYTPNDGGCDRAYFEVEYTLC